MTVSVAGVSEPTGKLQVYNGTKLLTTVTLTASGSGHKTIKLPVLTVGKHKIKVKYAGSTTIAKSASAFVVLTVTK